MNDRTVLVTGGAGYVGSHCCKALAEAGWRVVVFDNLSRGWLDFVKWGDLIEGDICDEERIRWAMAETRPDAVVHCAALAYVGESVIEPEQYYRVNTTGTLNVLRAMTATGVDRFLLSSTCATYGTPATLPVDENQPQRPINPYGWSKLFVEQMLKDFGTANGMKSIALRYFNAAGADPDFRIGERHDPETHLVPLAIRGASETDYELTVFGDDFDTRDGSCLRDYVHVCDLADAHRLALEHLDQVEGFEAFNLGTGTGTTVFEVADAVERVTGNRVRTRVGPRRSGDPGALVASAAKARAVLGWSPDRSGIDNIILDAWRWHRNDVGHNQVRTGSSIDPGARPTVQVP